MSDFSSAAAVIPAPAASPAALESAGASVLIEPSNDTGDDGGFDADAARAAAAEMLHSGDEAPAEAAEKPVDEKTTEELSEEERLAARKQKLSDEKGKLSQDKLDNAFAKLTAEGKRLRAKVEAHKAERATFETAKAQYDAAIEKAAERVNGQEKGVERLQRAGENFPADGAREARLVGAEAHQIHRERRQTHARRPAR
jgi:chromosome segregation ATPase